MVDLPLELIEKILDRVPKKSLIPFRCVSKLWRRLIDRRLSFDWAFTLCLFPMVSSRLYCIDLLHGGDMVEIENPLGWVRFVLLGSCYDLICISNCGDSQLAIWNVLTRKCVLLPPADSEIPYGLGLSVYGLGFDFGNFEFVLLRVVQTLRRPIVSEVSIYRETANTWDGKPVQDEVSIYRETSWRRLQGMPYFLVEPDRMGLPFHGRLYWIMRRERVRNSAKVLVAFDIYTESFVEVDLPNRIDNRLRMNLAILEEYLCLTIYGESGVVDVWIMRPFGLIAWHLLFSLRDHWWSFRPIQPLAFSLDGHRVLVLVSSNTFGWYNLQTRGVEPFHVNGMPTCSNLFVNMRGKYVVKRNEVPSIGVAVPFN